MTCLKTLGCLTRRNDDLGMGGRPQCTDGCHPGGSATLPSPPAQRTVALFDLAGTGAPCCQKMTKACARHQPAEKHIPRELQNSME